MRGHVGLAESLWAAAHGDADQFMESGGAKAIAIGGILAVLSAIANGTFPILAKTNAVRRAQVDPLIFQLWASIGVVISSLLFLLRIKFTWTPYGLLSGLFFVLSLSNSYRAVRLVGVSVGTGVWCGTAVLVSFVAGLLFDPQSSDVSSRLFAVIAIAVVTLGIVGISYAGHIGRVAAGQEENLQNLLQPQNSEDLQGVGTFSAGIFAALIAGSLGGLIMLPLTRTGESTQGVSYLPSFAIGVAVFSPIITAVPYLRKSQLMPDFAPTTAALPGIASGIIWNIGNILSIIAIGYISYSIAYPIMQCGIFIAGLWGMFLFDEMTGNSIIFYWLSGLIMIVGIVLLSWSH